MGVLRSKPEKSPHRLLGLLAPGTTFLVLTGLTGAVWHQEVSTQRDLLQRHTEDVTFQGARRLALFVEFRLSAAKLIARRWATHEAKDYTRPRFEGLTRALMAELPGIRAVQLVGPDLGPGWRVNASGPSGDGVVDSSLRALLQAAATRGTPVLSPPRGGGRPYHVAGLPLRRGDELVGHLAVELDSSGLIDACFLQRIRGEFSFVVYDGAEAIYAEGNEARTVGQGTSGAHASAPVPIANRTWHMVVAPRARQAAHHGGWRTSLPVPILGFALSVMLALMVHLLSRRMELYRDARDEAVRENEQRKQAEAELRASEARYRSIFDSASDGFLVVNGDGRIIDVNRAAAEMHGYATEDLRGRSLGELAAPAASGQMLEVLRILAGRGPVRLESRDQRKDGTLLDVELRGGQLVYDGAPAVLAIITDVTERRLAMERHAMLARKVLVAQEEERARIARELHDELGQLLTALRLELDWVRSRGGRRGAEEGPIGFGNAFELVEKAAAELRRICRGLRPPLLDDLGVDPAVRLLVNEFKERAGIAVSLEVHTEGSGVVPAETALCIYRILQESLTNVSRHSGASRVAITLGREGAGLRLLVSDDGHGFDPEHTGDGSGLAGMRERANLVNGKLRIASEQGKGTQVEFRVALAAEHVKETG